MEVSSASRPSISSQYLIPEEQEVVGASPVHSLVGASYASAAPPANSAAPPLLSHQHPQLATVTPSSINSSIGASSESSADEPSAFDVVESLHLRRKRGRRSPHPRVQSAATSRAVTSSATPSCTSAGLHLAGQPAFGQPSSFGTAVVGPSFASSFAETSMPSGGAAFSTVVDAPVNSFSALAATEKAAAQKAAAEQATAEHAAAEQAAAVEATALTTAPAAEASGAVSSAPAPAASQTSSVTTGGSGASDASAPLALERETDTLLDVYFPPMDKTYRGVVVKTFEKYGVDGVIVLYSDGEKWHDFGTHDQNCTFTVIEPPIQALEWIRRTANGFQGKLPHPQHGTIWDLIPANVKKHFHDPEANEGAWLDALTIADGFQRLPSGKKKKKVAAPAKKPDCVPGGLELGFAAAGDAEASAIVAEHEDAIIAAEGRKGDRIKYAAIDVVKPLCHYDARSIKVHPASPPSRMMPYSTLAPHRPHPPRLRLCLGRPEGPVPMLVTPLPPSPYFNDALSHNRLSCICS